MATFFIYIALFGARLVYVANAELADFKLNHTSSCLYSNFKFINFDWHNYTLLNFSHNICDLIYPKENLKPFSNDTIVILNLDDCPMLEKISYFDSKYLIKNFLMILSSDIMKTAKNVVDLRTFLNYENSSLSTYIRENKLNIFLISQRDYYSIQKEIKQVDIEGKRNIEDSSYFKYLGIINIKYKLRRNMGPFLLAIIVVLICIVGGYLGGREYFNKFVLLRKLNVKSIDQNSNHSINNTNENNINSNISVPISNSLNNEDYNLQIRMFKKENDKQSFSTGNVIFLIIFMSLFLFCIWYFYKYAVYFLIGFFTIYSTVSLYFIFKSFIKFIPFKDHGLYTRKFGDCLKRNSVDYFVKPSRTTASTFEIQHDFAIMDQPLNSHHNYGCLKTNCSQIKSCILRNFSELLLEILTIKHLIALILSLTFCFYWLVHRHDPYAFIFQDIMGASLCIYILKTIHIPNLKVGTLLLTLLFVFDIFFVFITPFLTKSKTSIMMDVVSGTNERNEIADLTSLFKISNRYESNNTLNEEPTHFELPPTMYDDDDASIIIKKPVEQVPLAFKMPYFDWILLGLSRNMDTCREYIRIESATYISYIGFGDVIMPGLLVSFCFFYDLLSSSNKRCKFIYSPIVSIGYIFGLIATYLALFLMKQGQPALLYLVPFTLGPVMLTALAKSEFKKLWHFDLFTEAKNQDNIYTLG